MEYFIYIGLFILLILGIFDIFVGVGNDAVNFMNSAIGSKAAKFRTILWIATAGLIIGALSSAGMMEIARMGIFNPQYFSFEDVLVIFLAVMLTDIVLLDAFNTNRISYLYNRFHCVRTSWSIYSCSRFYSIKR
ncbi:MAG: hypothetical protein IPG79_02370 [Saprospiraceae bacterium]|nr:hypothetical protein [Saprospiraceae bacterium]